MHEKTLQDCYCRWDDAQVVIGNGRIERAFDLSGGMPRPVSLLDRALGREWTPPGARRFLFRLPGMAEEPAESIEIECDTDDRGGLSGRFLRCTLRLAFPACTVETALRVHPGVPAVSMAHSVRGRPGRTDREEPDVRQWRECRAEATAMLGSEWPRPDTVESIPLPGGHLRARAVRFYDATDVFNTLVREEEALLYVRGYEKLQGNLLFLEDAAGPGGLLVIKEAPTVVGQLRYPGCDFHTARADLLEVRGTGLAAEELTPDVPLPCYGSTVGVFDPAVEDGDEALRAWYDAEDLHRPERDVYILSNTWGNRSLDRKVQEEFILAEIDRAAELGVDVCQIDCGWQEGAVIDPETGAVDTGGAFRQLNPGFWRIRLDRFPEEFRGIQRRAEERGVRIGAWFAPDKEDDFADWEPDRDVLLDLYRRFGMRHFKIDFVDIRSKLGEARLVDMLEGVLRESDGEVAFQIDLTNGHRQGYFHTTHVGEIFLENRYTDFCNYYPHYTLRNLWQLSKYVPSRRLEMEFLDLDRNPGDYPDDPLAPHHWSPDYAFAVTMVGSPLAWMEMSLLDEAEVGSLKPIIAACRRERERLFECAIWPVGEEPSGTSWTGFQALHPDGGGYLLLFRELNERGEDGFRLRGLRDCRLDLELLHGDGFESDGRVDADGCLTVALARPRSFAFLRYRQ